jgi:hypothetical protein
MWMRIGNFFWSALRFLAPERAAYETIIARYRTMLVEEREASDVKEKEYKEVITALRRELARERNGKNDCQEKLADQQRQIWELTAVIDAIEAVKRMREDPEFQRHTAEQVRQLMRGKSPDEANQSENPSG